MKLIIEPDAGEGPLLSAIKHARKLIDVLIFRLDGHNLTTALEDAVARGVTVRVLIAARNHGGTSHLRRLERRMLDVGAVVSRTKDDLVRYHGKMMLVDQRELFLLGFNLTHQDIDRSRTFGLITRNRDLVREAGRLFESDVKRHPYEPGSERFIVSPVNARQHLEAFLKGARKQLLIYDPEVSDPAMIAILEERAKAGVDVRIIGKLTRKSQRIGAKKLAIRLHTRTTIRDGKAAFLGSQSLRELELDARREIGVIFQDAAAIARMKEVFEEDWEHKSAGPGEELNPEVAAKVAKKVAKTVAGELRPVAPVVEEAVRKVIGSNGGAIEVDGQEVESIVKEAVQEAVREAVENAVEESVGGGK
jgi:cardiolipin synthase